MLQTESDALKNLIRYLNSDFDRVIQEILASSGRVVLTGIGKSAIIANKIVATLNSTGTPAVFMHAADAIHGDLGMIQKEDIVICISKSGNTPEIKVLIPLIKRLGVKLVGMISVLESYLDLNSDYTLYLPVEEEACPHNLAPTTSTTLQLAMGDAIAVCLLSSRNFSADDFAKYHPGGALGKRLYLKVDDIIARNANPMVNETTPIREIILRIMEGMLGATAVVDQNGKLSGIVTDGDLRRAFSSHNSVDELIASEIMSANPKTVREDTFATEALSTMQKHNITQLIVVNDSDSPLGFVHLHDLLKEGIV